MPEADRYTFTHKELIVALIKQARLHDGRWQLVAQFNFGAVNIGSLPGSAVPSAIVGITNMGLMKAPADAPPELVADAAEVNPAST